jgi:hypothetical protein
VRSLAFRANKLSWIVCGKVYLNSALGKARESSGKCCRVFFSWWFYRCCVSRGVWSNGGRQWDDGSGVGVGDGCNL